MKCSKFKLAMTGTSFADRPEWYITRNCPSEAAATPAAHERFHVQFEEMSPNLGAN
jgi:hypothetical protein